MLFPHNQKKQKNPRMSRIFVKNLPKEITDTKLRSHFSSKGLTVTDCKLLVAPDKSSSRRCAFLGFKSPHEALEAIQYYNRTFVGTCKIEVQEALPPKSTAKRAGEDQDGTPAKRERVEVSEGKAPSKRSEKNHDEFMKLMKPKSKAEEFWGEEEEKVSMGEEEEKVSMGKKKLATTTKLPPSNRVFVRNLPYACTKEELIEFFSPFLVESATLPVDASQRLKGFGIVEFADTMQAGEALRERDGQIFQGRLLHVIPGEPERLQANGMKKVKSDDKYGSSSYKTEKEEERRKNAGSKADQFSWHSLFVRSDAAAGAVAQQMGISKRELLLGGGDDQDDVAIRAAMSESKVVNEGKEFLRNQGVDLEALEASLSSSKKDRVAMSDTVLFAKNLPENTVESDLKTMFAKQGTLERFVMPSSKTMALISYHDAASAKRAMTTLAYTRYKSAPLYLQYAPEKILSGKRGAADKVEDDVTVANDSDDDDLEHKSGGTLFIKNLEFSVTEQDLVKHIKMICGSAAQHVSIPRRKGKNGEMLSAGYGFVEFSDEALAKLGLKRLQGTMLNGHIMDVQMSSSANNQSVTNKKKDATGLAAGLKTLPTKLIVRNLAFEATNKDVRKLFEAYADVKSVRLPKKMDGSIRGFAFVEFTSHQSAKTALKSLGAVHLYGRHLVVEWASADVAD